MPSSRRIRGYILLTIFSFGMILMFTSFLKFMSSSQPRDVRTFNDFLDKTTHGLDNDHGKGNQVVMGAGSDNPKDHDGDGHVDQDDEKLAQDMAERLRAAEQKAKELANAKAPKPDSPAAVVGVGSSAGGQTKGKGKNRLSKPSQDDEEEEEEDSSDGTNESSEVETMFNSILTRSPMIIFSKTYCPYSKKAKALLLDEYQILPAPYVVELDEHRLGKELQNLLYEKTGRKTVPNVLINGVTIGGSDDIALLEKHNTLVDVVKSKSKEGKGKPLTMTRRFERG
ncbi:thioredoxin-like protein [Xylariaceae sp. FL1272]|nr:thioredoxin-like protein [Xylariaceae sp. FL1272]